MAVVVLVVAVIGFAMFSTSSSQPEQLDVLPADTIPYEEPVVDDKPQTQVDTIVEQPEQPEVEEEVPEEIEQPAPEDTTGTVTGSSQSKTESNSHGHAAE